MLPRRWRAVDVNPLIQQVAEIKLPVECKVCVAL